MILVNGDMYPPRVYQYHRGDSAVGAGTRTA